jgi:hypothetical protein
MERNEMHGQIIGQKRESNSTLEDDFKQEKTAQSHSSVDSKHRLILLLGTARSGTSWLAKILDSYKNVLYQHEPMRKFRNGELKPLIQRILGDAKPSAEDQIVLHHELRQLNFRSSLPPFFPKDFLKRSSQGIKAYWLLARMLGVGGSRFGAWCRPIAHANYDILVKEVDWDAHADRLIAALRPDCLIMIYRHPCGVVNSRLKGVQLGTLPGVEWSGWIKGNASRLQALGVTTSEVAKMNTTQLFALDWALQTVCHEELIQQHPHAMSVLYEDLCYHPQKVAKRLFDFLGWKMEKTTENYLKFSDHNDMRASLFKRIWKKRSYFRLKKNSLQTSRNWRQDLSPKQQQEIMAIASLCEEISWWGEENAIVRETLDPA